MKHCRCSLRSVLSAICAVVAFACGRATAVDAMEATNSLRVVVHANGEARRVDEPGSAEAVRQLCEAKLEEATDLLKLAVQRSLIDRLRLDEQAIEIFYPRPATLTIRGRQVTIDRLLIPLTGDFAGTRTTIFYGDGEYASGPAIYPASPDDLGEAARPWLTR